MGAAKITMNDDNAFACAYVCPYDPKIVEVMRERINAELTPGSLISYLPSLQSVFYLVEILYTNRFNETKSLYLKKQHIHGIGYYYTVITDEEFGNRLKNQTYRLLKPRNSCSTISCTVISISLHFNRYDQYNKHTMQILIDYHNQLLQRLSALTSTLFKENISFDFTSGEMLEYQGEHTSKKCQMWDRFWKAHAEMDKPVIYWFSIEDSGITNSHILNAFENYRSQRLRNVPPPGTNARQSDSRILYVGSCRSTRIRDRFFWHTGYYKEGRTQGLQLCHWSIPLNLPLRLHYLPIDPELKDLTTVYEKELARQLQPLLGKHK